MLAEKEKNDWRVWVYGSGKNKRSFENKLEINEIVLDPATSTLTQKIPKYSHPWGSGFGKKFELKNLNAPKKQKKQGCEICKNLKRRRNAIRQAPQPTFKMPWLWVKSAQKPQFLDKSESLNPPPKLVKNKCKYSLNILNE